MSCRILLAIFMSLLNSFCKGIGNHTSNTSGPKLKVYPYLAALYYNYPDNFTCSGFLVHPQWVLTSATCFSMETPTHVGFGMFDRNAPCITRKIEEFIPHGNFEQDSDPGLKNIPEGDIAMIKLGTPVNLTNRIKLLALEEKVWPKNGRNGERSVRDCLAIGFGVNNNEDSFAYSKMFKVRSGPSSCECYNRSVNGLCADSHLGNSLCPGDAGGPLLCDGKAAGIAATRSICKELLPEEFLNESYNLCGKGYRNFFTPVQPYAEWIKACIETDGFTGVTKKGTISSAPTPLFKQISNLAPIALIILLYLFLNKL